MEEKKDKKTSVKKKKKPMKIMDVVLYALLFVFFWATINQYRAFGINIAIHAVLKLILACVFAWLTHVIYYLIADITQKKTFENFWVRLNANNKKISRNVPFITATILAIRFRSQTPLFVIIIAAILAELVGKLIWGGFGKNRINPVAVGFLLTDLMFERFNRMPEVIDGITSATPLSGIAPNGWYFGTAQYNHFLNYFGNWWDLLIGNTPAPSAEMARLAIIIAFAFMLYKKALDWIIPVYYLGTIALITLIIALTHGFSITYPLYHLLTGGVLFGAIFMATDPVTIPKNKPGKTIFAIGLGLLTLAIRIGSSRFPEGMMIALVVMNLLSPWINELAAPLVKKDEKIKNMSYGLIFLTGFILVFIVSLVNTRV